MIIDCEKNPVTHCKLQAVKGNFVQGSFYLQIHGVSVFISNWYTYTLACA